MPKTRRLSCGRLHREQEILMVAGQIQQGRRKTRGAGPGRPRKLQPCPACGASLTATERRAHRCEKEE